MKYVIINFEDVTQAMIDDCHESSFDSLRHSVAGDDRVVLKYSGDDPAWIVTLGLTPRSHAEILSDLSDEDWQGDPS
jgi:hypothetical protein